MQHANQHHPRIKIAHAPESCHVVARWRSLYTISLKRNAPLGSVRSGLGFLCSWRARLRAHF